MPGAYLDPTPRSSPGWGTLADAIRAAKDFIGTDPWNDNKPNVIGKIADAMGAGDLADTADRLSYGERLTSGSGQTTKLRDETLGAAMALPIGKPAKGGKLLGEVAGAAAERAGARVLAEGEAGTAAKIMRESANDPLTAGTLVSPVNLNAPANKATGTTRGLAKFNEFDPATATTPADKAKARFVETLGRDPEQTITTQTEKRLGDDPSPKDVVQAQEDALRELRWKRLDKPELEAQYGTMARAPYDAPGPRRLQTTPDETERRVQTMLDFLRQPTEPWQPREYAFDRSSIKDALEGFPGVEQTRYQRYQPSDRTDLTHVDAMFNDPRNRDLIKAQIMRGLPLGGESFYASLWPVMQDALQRGIPREQVAAWIESVAPASARNSIINENAVGNALIAAHARGEPLNAQTALAINQDFKQRFGTGLPMMPVHVSGVDKVLQGGGGRASMLGPPGLAANTPEYKIGTYGGQKAGDFAHSYVGDVHEAGGLSMGTNYHPYFREQGGFPIGEYGRMESGMLGIANEMGLPGGMAQAGRWFGGGELTGLMSPRGDALDILEKQIAYTLKQQGKDYGPRDVRDYTMKLIQEGGDLLPWFQQKQGMPDVRF